MQMKLSTIVVQLFRALTPLFSGFGGSSEAQKHYDTGVELAEQGRPEDAIVEYDEAIRLKPQDAEVYTNRGRRLQ